MLKLYQNIQMLLYNELSRRKKNIYLKNKHIFEENFTSNAKRPI
jgi:hypothetical protein